MSSFTEAQYAGVMAAWADATAADPAWRDLIWYRGVSAIDAGYMHLYFRLLEQVRAAIERDASERIAPPPSFRDVPLRRRVRRGVDDLVRGKLSLVAFGRHAARRLVDEARMALPPRTIDALGDSCPGLVVAAAPNATGFPVLEALQQTEQWPLAFASWSRTVEPSVKALGIPYLHMADTYRRRFTQLRRRHAAEVAAVMCEWDAGELTARLSHLAGRDVTFDAASVLQEICCEARVQTDLYFDLFERLRPRALVLFNDMSLRERPAARVASQLGVRSVTLQHGLLFGYVYRSLATDLMVVWGETPRAFWVERARTPDQVVSVGAFGHEKWLGDAPPRAARMPGQERTVLFLGQNPAAFISPRIYRASSAMVFDAARRLPDVQFIVRPHPGESREAYEGALTAQPLHNVVIRTTDDLPSLLRRVDAVLTVFSTAGLEAMLLETPVVVLNPSSEPPLAPYAPVMPVAKTAEELAQAIVRYGTDSDERRAVIAAGRTYAADYVGSVSGGAAARAASAIGQLVAAPIAPGARPALTPAMSNAQSIA